jgi:hypothetical protein
MLDCYYPYWESEEGYHGVFSSIYFIDVDAQAAFTDGSRPFGNGWMLL